MILETGRHSCNGIPGSIKVRCTKGSIFPYLILERFAICAILCQDHVLFSSNDNNFLVDVVVYALVIRFIFRSLLSWIHLR